MPFIYRANHTLMAQWAHSPGRWFRAPFSVQMIVMVPRTIINKTWQSFNAKRRINRTISCCQFSCISFFLLGGHIAPAPVGEEEWLGGKHFSLSLYKSFESRMHRWLRFVQVIEWKFFRPSIPSLLVFRPPLTTRSITRRYLRFVLLNNFPTHSSGRAFLISL